MDPFESYKLYNALKLHFEQDSYDAIKYNFKSNIKPQSFFARKDKFFFAKLAKNYGDNLLDYYVANFKNGVSYVGDMINEEGESNYTRHKKVMESLTREFQKDINKFYKHYMNGKNVIGVHVRHGNGEEKRTKHFENRVICKFNAFIHSEIDFKKNFI